VAPGDSGREAYTAIAWGVGLSHERSDIAGAESVGPDFPDEFRTDVKGRDFLHYEQSQN
jgi:hypothetical protein